MLFCLALTFTQDQEMLTEVHNFSLKRILWSNFLHVQLSQEKRFSFQFSLTFSLKNFSATKDVKEPALPRTPKFLNSILGGLGIMQAVGGLLPWM